MKISIIIPSYNSGRFLEATIQSIIDQSYPYYEIIVIDGGSTDQTLEIIEKYREHITYFVSEKDRGQSHAINKGLRQVSGEIWAWQNADDLYLPGTFQLVADRFKANPSIGMLYGGVEFIGLNEELIYQRKAWKYNYHRLRRGRFIPVQPAVFFSTQVIKDIGYIDESINYVMDRDYFTRLGRQYPIVRVDEFLGQFRLHPESKSASKKNRRIVREERDKIIRKHSTHSFWDRMIITYYHYYILFAYQLKYAMRFNRHIK